jgi:hypothetical protein
MSTTREHSDAWVCVDCYFAHHGADESDAPTDREPLSLIDDGAEVTDNTCSSHDGDDETACEYCGQTDYENGIQEFSWRSCEGCGSTLGGARYRLAVWS